MTRLDPNHAIFPGSFDPPTLGHLDLIERALERFELVTLAVGAHPTKSGLLDPDEREQLLRTMTAELASSERLEFMQLSGLLVDGCRDSNAGTVLRGLRNGTDFEYESQMAATNRSMEPGVDTLYLGASPGHAHLSSTLVRQIFAMGGDITELVPETVASFLASRR
ncbi:MAG: pantetheine-phosphate adenylyltransferase [Planctomycetota bacterium]|nr:pantetheine-phosphate adenylyltransferase [Planctomycetota bacterium]MDG2142632.1 pantetheine-phosphate adenylyltransferase [Planctomycetota bacterium]